MTNEERYIRPDSKILVALEDKLPWDGRLLIPFTSKDKLGLLNDDMKVVVPPKYSAVYGDCYTTDDYLIVSKRQYVIKYDAISGDTLEPEETTLFGVINWKGEELIPSCYYEITLIHDGENKIYRVTDENGEYNAISIYHKKRCTWDRYCVDEFFPWPKMAIIDPFREGLGRVCRKYGNKKETIEYWGIVDDYGKWVKWPSKGFITPFYDPQQSLITITTEKGIQQIPFEELKEEWEREKNRRMKSRSHIEEHYSLLEDGLDGMTDAYWNID